VLPILLTPELRRALEIVRDHPAVLGPGTFAFKMWPESPGWSKLTKISNRNGVRHGAMMPMTGGSYLEKLRKKGLIVGRPPSITKLGLEALARTKPTVKGPLNPGEK
jgi:hypothetical protein